MSPASLTTLAVRRCDAEAAGAMPAPDVATPQPGDPAVPHRRRPARPGPAHQVGSGCSCPRQSWNRIAVALGVSRHTTLVRRSGRPAVHGPSTRLAVIAIATSVPPDVESQWSHALIASELRKRGLEISPATIGRILADAHVRPHKVRGWLNRADDPGFWARAGQVCRLYLDPPHDRDTA